MTPSTGVKQGQDVELLRDKNVVAVIDFRHTTIYPTDASPGQRPEHLVATDPRGRFHQVHHRAGNPEGIYEDDSPEYWREVTEALAPAAAILLLGHGAGKAMRLTTGWPMPRSTARMSPRRSSPTCGPTSIIWMTRRCYGWRSTTLPGRP